MVDCVMFIRNQLDDKFFYLTECRKWSRDCAIAYISHMISDFKYFMLSGLSVRSIYMNPDGDYGFNQYTFDNIDNTDYLKYYCLSSKTIGIMNSVKIPEFELNNEGIPHVYETIELANESLTLYNEYFKNPHLEIIKYRN